MISLGLYGLRGLHNKVWRLQQQQQQRPRSHCTAAVCGACAHTTRAHQHNITGLHAQILAQPRDAVSEDHILLGIYTHRNRR